MFATGCSGFGRLGLPVNSAWSARPVRRGYSRVKTREDADVDWALHLGRRAALWAMQAMFPGMRQRRWGRVINRCSLDGINPYSFSLDYNVAQAALRTLTRTAARE